MSFALLNKSLQAAFSVCGRSDVFFFCGSSECFFLQMFFFGTRRYHRRNCIAKWGDDANDTRENTLIVYSISVYLQSRERFELETCLCNVTTARDVTIESSSLLGVNCGIKAAARLANRKYNNCYVFVCFFFDHKTTTKSIFITKIIE